MPTPRRRWFRFSLRTFLVIVALVGAWLGVQVKWSHDRRTARAAMRSWTPADMRASGVPMDAEVPWVLALLGEQPVSVIVVPKDGPFSARELRALFPEAQVTYEGNPKDFE